MKVVNIKKVAKQKLGKPIFTGQVIRQSPITDEEGSDLSVDYVYFPKGVRNEFHTHSNDQVLIGIQGEGFVETEDEKLKLSEGDVVWSPAGEVHRHGAGKVKSFVHVSVTRAKTKLTLVDMK